MNVAVIGLGKLGSSLAAVFAAKGHHVIGTDVSEYAVAKLNAGQEPVFEQGLAELIAANSDRLEATLDTAEAIAACDISFVIVPTPSSEDGSFSLDYVRAAFQQIAAGIHQKSSYHVVVLVSTVLPGSLRFGVLPALEEAVGRPVGDGYGVCYCPAFIALGNIISNFLNPDLILLGESDARAGAFVETFYASVVGDDVPCQRMSLENAELTKIALNSFVTMKITFANIIAQICERMPGGDVDIVTNALGLDERIGPKYLKGGIGFGGPCFPRDNAALSFIARELGGSAELAETTHRANQAYSMEIVARALELGEANLKTKIAVLGLAYKPGTNFVEESPGISLANAWADAGMVVIGYDPLAGETAKAELHEDVLIAEDIDSCIQDADLVFITTPDAVFQNLAVENFNVAATGVQIVDFWRILDSTFSEAKNLTYLPSGRNINRAAGSAILERLWNNKGMNVAGRTTSN